MHQCVHSRRKTSESVSESHRKEGRIHLVVVLLCANDVHFSGSGVALYIKYLVKQRWSIASTAFVCPHYLQDVPQLERGAEEALIDDEPTHLCVGAITLIDPTHNLPMTP